MAVVEVVEQVPPGGGISAQGRTEPRTFQVLLDGADPVAQASIIARQASTDACRIPRYGESHPYDPWVSVDDINVRPADERGMLLWIVTVSYRSRQAPGGTGGAPEGNPLDEPARYSWRCVDVVEPCKYAASNVGNSGSTVIANTAGEPFDMSTEFGELEVTIERNEAVFPADKAYKLKNTTNAAAMSIDGWKFGPGQGKLRDIQGQQAGTGKERYYACRYVVGIRHHILNETGGIDTTRAWWRRFLNEGTWELDIGGGGGLALVDPFIVNITDSHGETVTSPVPLRQDGTRIPRDANGQLAEARNFILVQPPPGQADWGPLRLS